MQLNRVNYLDDNDYEYKVIKNPLKDDEVESFTEIYEHFLELENNKPIGNCPSWNKKYAYYKSKLEKFNI